MKQMYKEILVGFLIAAILLGIVIAIAFPGSLAGNVLHVGKIEEMAAYLNEKYGYSVTALDCVYFREEDYSWHGNLLGFGTTYNIPFIGAFDVDGEVIVVADRKGVISDNAQLDEINDLVCGYFESLIDLDIEYVEIRDSGNGNSVDHTINHILQYSFPQMITKDNIADFMEYVWDTKHLELIFYFQEADDVDAQVEDITGKLKTLGREHQKLRSLRFYIRRSEVPLDLQLAQPDLNTEYLEYNTSSDHSDDYKFGGYYIRENYYDLVDFYVRGGICQLGRGYDSGLGSYESTEVNGWKVAVFHKLNHYERNNVDQGVIDHYHKEFGKVYCDVTLDDDYKPGYVRIVVYPFALNFAYVPEDFQEIGCKEVTDISGGMQQDTHPSRVLLLKLEDDSKQTVLDAIGLLMERDDVYYAEPVRDEEATDNPINHD